MSNTKDDQKVFGVECPVCHSTLWIDPQTKKVVRSDRVKRKSGSLDDLLKKEQERKREFGRKFEATAELEKEKKKKAQEKFSEAFDSLEPEENSD